MDGWGAHLLGITMGSTTDTTKNRPTRKELALRMGAVQREAQELEIPAIIVIEGLDGSGKGLLLNKLILELDARSFDIYSTHASDQVAREYPLLWRMWCHTPPAGKVRFFDRGAYYLALDAWAEGMAKPADLARAWRDLRRFEQQLADAGTLLLKVLLTVSKKEQARRFRELAANPKTAWRVTEKDWKRHEQYHEYLKQARAMIAATEAPHAPWKEIATDDLPGATTELYELVIAAFEDAIARRRLALRRPEASRRRVRFKGTDHLAAVDLSASLERDEYKRLLKKRQAEMHDLAHQIHAHRIPVVMAYCGWDAAGKGGCIKRLLQGIDPRSFTVVPVGAPSRLELSHHYLWRFWRELPPRGKITIFDRSWYGRVLVERVEGFCSNAEWMRAYREINEMEEHLTDFGVVLVKFWLHIDFETQLARFRAREENPLKRWKITAEDWRNRDKHALYEEAVNEMIERTHTPYAPWEVIASNCKLWARIRTLDVVIAAMRKAVKKRRRAV
jgi:AMP-polyphosphate phosphotransferase